VAGWERLLDNWRILVAVRLQIVQIKAVPKLLLGARRAKMKTMHWLGVVATSLISLNALSGCSGDDPPAAMGMSGAPGTAGTGATAGTSAGGSGGGSSSMGVQLKGPAAYTILSTADAPTGTAAPAAYGSTCGLCHGPAAQGTDQLAPEIRFTPTDYFKAVVRGGRKDVDGAATGMAAFTTAMISDTDLDAVAAWLNGLPKPTTPDGLYKAMCGNCHGPKMPTGGSAPISIQGAAIADVDKYVRMGNGTDFNNRKEYMPKFDTTLLTEAELGMIKTFIGAK
jgi:mono/diheme cytochrome c family protein